MSEFGHSSEAVKRLAESQVAMTDDARMRIFDEVSSSSKWLMASLLALNGGAAAAIMNSDFLTVSAKVVPLVLFYVGTMAALLIAFFGQLAHRAMVGPIGEANLFWIETAAAGEVDEIRWREIEGKITRAIRVGSNSKFAGWVAVLAFSAGVAVAGVEALWKTA